MAEEIPFTTFRGQLKQLETEFRAPVMGRLFNACFSAFEDIDRQYASLKAQGIHQLISAAGSEINFGFRPRRFAGGPGLPPGRYFTVCDGGAFEDAGTLRDELTAYYSAASGIHVTILDPKVDRWVLDYLRDRQGMSPEDLAYPLLLYIYTLERRTERNAHLIDGEDALPEGATIAITYGVREIEATLDKVIDLRDPNTQDWFSRTFVSLEIENAEAASRESGIVILGKEPIEGFQHLLPVISSLETGGGMAFGQAVGHWLRRHGANALIFPSARSNCYVKVVDGALVSCGGWNMVVYAEASEPVSGSLFGRMSSWRDRDHDHIRVQYTADGAARGSFSIRGVREFNVFDFDLHKRVACGMREDNPVEQVTGVYNALLSRAVNDLLDQEAAQRELWYNDNDYSWLVQLLEREWRKGDGH